MYFLAVSLSIFFVIEVYDFDQCGPAFYRSSSFSSYKKISCPQRQHDISGLI